MKKITLSINLDDNEVLDKSVQEAIMGQAKQIARETLEKELRSEIERITEKKIDSLKTDYYNDVSRRISDSIFNRLNLHQINNSENINKIVEEKVTTYLDKKVLTDGGMEKFIRDYIGKSIESLLLERYRAQS